MKLSAAARVALAMGVALLVLAEPARAQSPGGYEIVNRSTATYRWQGTQYSIASNEVVTTVLTVYGVSLVPDGTATNPGQERLATAGMTVYLPYVLRNTGNRIDSYDLAAFLHPSSTFAPLTPPGLNVYLDINGNGILDPGEPAVTTLSGVGPGLSKNLILGLQVPPGTPVGRYALVDLRASSLGEPGLGDRDNYARVTVSDDAVVTLSKQAVPQAIEAGEEVEYALTGSNVGTKRAKGIALRLNTASGSVDQTGVFVVDAIPDYGLGNRYVSGSLSASPAGILIFSPDGTTWYDTELGAGGAAAVRWLGYLLPGGLAPDVSFRIRFRVATASGYPTGILSNTATLRYLDNQASPQEQTVTSNRADVAVEGPVSELFVPLIGPRGDPEAQVGGDTNADVTVYDGTPVAGNTVTFVNTVKNAGNLTGVIDIQLDASSNLPAGWTVSFYAADGVTLLSDSDGSGSPDVGLMLPGVEKDMVVKIAIPPDAPSGDNGGGGFDAVIRARSSILATAYNLTTDRLQGITGLADFWDPFLKEVQPAGEIASGDSLVYSNTFGNRGTVSATDVIITDRMPDYLVNPREITNGTITDLGGTGRTITVSGSYDAGNRTVSWQIPDIPPGFSGRVSFRVDLDPAAPPGVLIENRMSIASTQTPSAFTSNTVSNRVLGNFLRISKTVNQERASIGDFVLYTITVENVSETVDLFDLEVRDAMPYGFRYKTGTSRLAGHKIPDPAVSRNGSTLRWSLGNIAPGEAKILTFVALLGANAHRSNGINTAYARTRTSEGLQIDAGPARARTRPDKGIFEDVGIIGGKVFLDLDGNGLQDPGEFGLPAVRLYMENGTYTQTDREGKYHIEGVRLGDHVVKVDRTTVPRDLIFISASNRHMGAGSSRFVDMKVPGFYRANFALAPHPERLSAERVLLEIDESPESTARAVQRTARVPKHTAGTPNRATGPPEHAAGTPERAAAATAGAPERAAKAAESGKAEAMVPLQKRKAGASILFRAKDAVLHPAGELALERLFRGRRTRPVRVVLHLEGDRPAPGGPSPLPGGPSPLLGFRLQLAAARAGRIRDWLCMRWGLPKESVTARWATLGHPVQLPDRGTGGKPRGKKGPGEARIPGEGTPRRGRTQETILEKPVEKPMGILEPADGSVFITRDEITVRVRGAITDRIALRLNGEEVPQRKIGRKRYFIKKRLREYTYYAVKLRKGKNTLQLVRTPIMGKEVTEEIAVLLANRLKKLYLYTLPNQIPADGRTEPKVILKAVDENDVPAPDGTFLTIQVDRGEIRTPDAHPHMEGHQIRVRDGLAELRLSASHVVEDRLIRVEAGNLKKERTISFLPYLRDWIIAGMGRGTLGWNKRGKNRACLSGTAKDDGLYVDGRLAFFAQGRILGSYLLTVAYDSDKEKDRDRLYQRIDPDRYYPVYGDGSEQHYAAQSQTKLFVKIERDRSYIMWGDFDTDIVEPEFAQYRRTFNGVKAHIDTKYLEVKGFGSPSDQVIVQDEIRGKGISGYYYLSHGHIVEQSDKVRIEVRDRYHPEIVVSREELGRYHDYDIDYRAGSILFKEPVRSQDELFNPVYIVVVYETREGASKEWFYGGRAKLKLLDDRIQVAGTVVREEQKIRSNTLYGADLLLEPVKGLQILGEYARSKVFDLVDTTWRKGEAWKVEARWERPGMVKARAYYRDVDPHFVNPSMSGFEVGTRKAGAEAELRLAARTAVQAEAYRAKNVVTGYRVDTVAADIKQGFWRLEGTAGYRYLHSRDAAGTRVNSHVVKGGLLAKVTDRLILKASREQVLSSRNGVGEAFPNGTSADTGSNAAAGPRPEPSGSLPAQPPPTVLGDGHPNRTTLGVEYSINDHLRAYLNHEIEDGDARRRRRTVFGVEKQLWKTTSVFSSYRIEDAMSGPRTQASVGLRNRIGLTENLTGNLTVERVYTGKGDDSGDFIALSAGLEYLPERYKLSSKFETRVAEQEVTYLWTFDGATRLSLDLSLFGRERLFIADYERARMNTGSQMLLGLAWRPVGSDRLHLLLQGRYEYNALEAREGDEITSKLILSLDVNLKPVRSWEILLHYALKYQKVKLQGDHLSSYTDLASARVLYDITDRWDAGVHGAILHQYETDTYGFSLGVEAGVRIVKNVWLSVGYNFVGFEDDDFHGNDCWSEGPYITLRVKFDEQMLDLFQKKRGETDAR
jgi:uncharacterized repeat protein (TIGR01451 family)